MTDTEKLWKGGERQRVLVRWYATRWCNYKCHYCPQEHERKQTYRGSPGHWADNATPNEWIAAFRKHFSGVDLALCFTGGEPMLDKRATNELLNKLLREPYVVKCKIDTNGTWNPSGWTLPKEKLSLMMSYHPTQANMQTFLKNLDGLLKYQWPVVLVNWVMLPGHFGGLMELTWQLKDRGIPLNLLPVDGSNASYTDAEKLILDEYLMPDSRDICNGVSPMGEACLHPAVSYKVYPNGDVEVGCHEHLTGSLFSELPKLFKSYVPCPRDQCLCLEKWTFLERLGLYNVDPLPIDNYVRRLRSLPVIGL